MRSCVLYCVLTSGLAFGDKDEVYISCSGLSPYMFFLLAIPNSCCSFYSDTVCFKCVLFCQCVPYFIFFLCFGKTVLSNCAISRVTDAFQGWYFYCNLFSFICSVFL